MLAKRVSNLQEVVPRRDLKRAAHSEAEKVTIMSDRC